MGAGGQLYCHETLDRRQQFKRQLLTDKYNSQVSDQLAERLLYVDRQRDQVIITLRGYAGAAGGRVIDKGDRMAASRRGNDAEVMTLINLAKVKGWKQIHLTGTESFKARAYIEAARAGLAVVGYKPSPETRAQLQKKEKPMFGQEGAGGMMALTPDVDVPAAKATPASRWLAPLRAAREKLEAEHKTAKERLAVLQETDLKKLELDLAAEHGGEEYRDVLRDFKAAAAAAKDAGAFARKQAETKKEKAWQAFQQSHARALAAPAAAQRLAEATKANQTREQLTTALTPIQLGIGQIQHLESAIEKGRDPEVEFLQAWKYRKQRPLQRWQELVITPVFEADAARAHARLKAETEAADQVKHAQRQEQIQREIAAQQQADAIQEQLGQPGWTADQEEVLEQQQRYYQALADGHDKEEAKERATKKSNAPRP